MMWSGGQWLTSDVWTQLPVMRDVYIYNLLDNAEVTGTSPKIGGWDGIRDYQIVSQSK